MRFSLLYFLLSTAFVSFSQNDTLQIKEIMAGNSFIGYQLYNLQWSPDGKFIFYHLDTDSTAYSLIYRYSTESKKTQRIDYLTAANTVKHQENTKRRDEYFSLTNNHLVQINRSNNQQRTIIQTESKKSELQHVTDQNTVYFRQHNNLFRYNGKDGTLHQKTRFKKSTSVASIEKPNPKSYYQLQEEQLFESIKAKKRLKKAPKDKQREISIGDKKLHSIQISPNEKYIVYRTSKKPQKRHTKVPHYLTSNGYLKIERARPKVGNYDPVTYQLNVFNRDLDSSFLVDFGALSGIRKRPEYQKEYGKTGDLKEDKKLFIHTVDFSKSGEYALISIKSVDNKDRWLLTYQFATNKLKGISNNSVWNDKAVIFFRYKALKTEFSWAK